MAEAKTNSRVPAESWSELLTPEALAQYGALEVTWPGGEFDPRETWTQSWQIFALRRTTKESHFGGHIEITRKAVNGGVGLSIRQANIQATHLARSIQADHPCMKEGVFIRPVHDTHVDLVCRDDQLLTPESWTLQEEMRCPEGKPFEGTRLSKAMRIKDGRIETECEGRKSLRPLPSGKVTSNWGLLNALSMVKGKDIKRFTMLDELDKIKAGHRLYQAKERTIEFGGKHIKVFCYHQIGQGCLPWEYYVDASTSRLLLAISGLRAYILDSDAAEKTARIFAGFESAKGAAQ